MKSPVTEAVNRLILNRKFTVARQGHDLILVKMIGKRPVTIKLKATSTSSFWVENPERDDRCLNSFFEFTMTPKRVTRNKDIIRIFVKTLKEVGLWKFIENKDFFKINTVNTKAKKKTVLSLYEAIRYGE
jgi:hypothetical protein